MNPEMIVSTLLLTVAVASVAMFYLLRTTRQIIVELRRSVSPKMGGSK